MLIDTVDEIRVAGRAGTPRSRPDRLLADKRFPLKANRAWRREHSIAMRSDKTAPNYHAALCLAATLQWV